jgi:hypothetical protein
MPIAMDIALASCRTLPEPDPDAAPLGQALAAAGLEAEVLAWDHPRANWSKARMTVLRSTWNYPLHLDAFLNWAESVARVSALWNPLPIVRWNSHKRYMLDLEANGIRTAPTVFLSRGSVADLGAVLAERGWEEVVVKPAVSAASFRTLRIAPGNLDVGKAHLGTLLADGDVLVQQYLSSVEGYGERALIWIDGELTHAVRKSPRFAGEDESVSTAAVDISPDEAALARRVLNAVDGELLYGRVDVAPGPDGEPVVMELELIEPSLFFPQCPPALDRFVAGIQRRLSELPTSP